MPKLPKEILRKRLMQEIKMCKRKLTHGIKVDDPELKEFPITVEVKINKVPGPVVRNNRVTHKWDHRFTMRISEDYPYEKPVVRWQTEIFHPNIMMPADGGYVCTRLLDTWDFQSNLLSFIQAVESLLSNPNPRSPYGSESCMDAAHYFIDHNYMPPGIVSTTKGGPKIVSGD